MWLQAVELELGMVFGAVYHAQEEIESKRKEDFVRGELSIPNDRRIVVILGFGFSKKKQDAKHLHPRYEIIRYDSFD